MTEWIKYFAVKKTRVLPYFHTLQAVSKQKKTIIIPDAVDKLFNQSANDTLFSWYPLKQTVLIIRDVRTVNPKFYCQLESFSLKNL